MNVLPITPAQVIKERKPNRYVLQAMNEEITRTFDGKKACVMLDHVASIAGRLMWVDTGRPEQDCRAEMFRARAFDVEDHYRHAGWDVTYEQPGYNEMAPSAWYFRPAKTAP